MTEPSYIQASVDWGVRSSGVENPPLSCGDIFVSIRGKRITEAVEFDTRTRKVRYLIFKSTPRPVWAPDLPVAEDERFLFPQDEENTDIVTWGEYWGPFRVEWVHEDGSYGSFDVPSVTAADRIEDLFAAKVK